MSRKKTLTELGQLLIDAERWLRNAPPAPWVERANGRETWVLHVDPVKKKPKPDRPILWAFQPVSDIERRLVLGAPELIRDLTKALDERVPPEERVV